MQVVFLCVRTLHIYASCDFSVCCKLLHCASCVFIVFRKLLHYASYDFSVFRIPIHYAICGFSVFRNVEFVIVIACIFELIDMRRHGASALLPRKALTHHNIISV